MKRNSKMSAAWLCLPTLLLFAASASSQFDAELFSGMKARSIGPAGMSGRIGDIAAVISNTNIIYVGAASGGVWRSLNGGLTWEPLFDEQPVSSIGSITVFQANPSIVWVGSGEGNPRNSVGVGVGAFKSLDGGTTWHCIGLEKTERIHRMVLHPNDPDIAYAGALGTTWGESPERGVFKTVDGGRSWRKVLYVDGKTGCCDLVMDHGNPNKLIAAMWEHRRWPWFFKSGGPGSGIYITHDGGENWSRLTEKEGMPEGDMGRTGVAIARSNPDIVYALIEAEKNALYRSEDGGRHWQVVNQSADVSSRPFYYADIRVDPDNENRLYSLQSDLMISEDGGKSFQSIRSSVHSDHHALWINPLDGRFLIDGNDGGIAISYDRGKTWRFVENLPLAQFYHINIDMEIPFNVYGGMQDNGSWRGPSDIWEDGGIKNHQWQEVGFGDGFATLSDPTDPGSGYCMSQGGNLMRFNVLTGERKAIRPPDADTIKLRFNWNAAIAIDPFEPHTVYYGSQFVHKSVDRGESWTIISPDLTTNNPDKQKQDESGGLTYDVTGAENHTTIITIAPSPVQRGLLWVGTDDGQVQVTRNGGSTWTNVTNHIPKLAANTWCPHLEASKYDAGTAYAVFDDHRRSDWTTYIYKTENFGESWLSLTQNDPTFKKGETGIEKWGFVHVIEQDPVKKELLYLGTEFGLYISFDDGRQWMKWKHGVPTVPVQALIVHPRDHDLVVGTHGRAAYVLDDVRPLRSISPEIIDTPLHLFEVPPAYQHHVKAGNGYHFPADAYFSGEGKEYGALITYCVNKDAVMEREASAVSEKLEDKAELSAEETQADSSMREAEDMKVTMEIVDRTGEVIRHIDGPLENGINRIYWDLCRDGYKSPYGSTLPSGPQVPPGTYTVCAKIKDVQQSRSVEILPDPRVADYTAAYTAKYELMVKAYERSEVIAEAVQKLQRMDKIIDTILETIKDEKGDSAKVMKAESDQLKKRLKGVLDIFLTRSDKQGIWRSEDLSRKFYSAIGPLHTSFDRPNPTELANMRRAEEALAKALDEYNTFFARDVAEFRQKIEAADFTLFFEAESLEVNWRPKKEK